MNRNNINGDRKKKTNSNRSNNASTKKSTNNNRNTNTKKSVNKSASNNRNTNTKKSVNKSASNNKSTNTKKNVNKRRRLNKKNAMKLAGGIFLLSTILFTYGYRNSSLTKEVTSKAQEISSQESEISDESKNREETLNEQTSSEETSSEETGNEHSSNEQTSNKGTSNKGTSNKKSKFNKEYLKIKKIVKKHKNDIAILVNKKNPLKSSEDPSDLVKVSVKMTKPEIYLKETTSIELEKMFKDAINEGLDIYLVSGYRSSATQEILYNDSIRRNGQEYTDKYKAKPFYSEHQTGLAVDLSCQAVEGKISVQFENTPEFKWISTNAHKYGFILRYKNGDEDRTGYGYEPWHYRYVGEEIATYIYENNLILEDLY